MTFDYLVKAVATGLSYHTHTAVAWVRGLPVQSFTKDLALYHAPSYATAAFTWAQAHPVTAVTTLNFGLTPFLGFGWMPALAHRAAGFGNLGVVAGMPAAWFQAYVFGGHIPAGGVFPALQAWGATMGF